MANVSMFCWRLCDYRVLEKIEEHPHHLERDGYTRKLEIWSSGTYRIEIRTMPGQHKFFSKHDIAMVGTSTDDIECISNLEDAILLKMNTKQRSFVNPAETHTGKLTFCKVSSFALDWLHWLTMRQTRNHRDCQSYRMFQLRSSHLTSRWPMIRGWIGNGNHHKWIWFNLHRIHQDCSAAHHRWSRLYYGKSFSTDGRNSMERRVGKDSRAWTKVRFRERL